VQRHPEQRPVLGLPGGGGGNFGIATSFTFRTHHLTQLVQFFLSWPWSRAARVVAGWQSWAPFQPDALWSNLHLSAAQRGGTPVIQVGGTYLGSVAGCQRLLSGLYTAVGSRPVNPNNVFLSSYRNAMLIEAGCSWPVRLRVPSAVTDQERQAAPGTVVRQVRLLHPADTGGGHS
jgi:hypothetical protein